MSDDHEIVQFEAAFTAAPWVDARLVPDAGHCIDVHLAARAFPLEQLASALECTIAAKQPVGTPIDAPAASA